jgi:hypothetical protein
MRAVTLVATGGAVTGFTGAVELLGAEFHHTTDANVVISTASGGQVIMTLKTTDEKETDWRFFGEYAFQTNADFYYNITTGGTLTLWVK